jgi:hypothetical protein
LALRVGGIDVENAAGILDTDQPRRRRRRSSRSQHRVDSLHVAAITGAIVLGGALALLIGYNLARSSPASLHAAVAAPNERATPAAAHDGTSARPVLRYSVVSGGVYGAGEVAAAKANDPVVAIHYEDIVPAALTPTVVTYDRLVYVSYRKNDQIYWTRNKVLLRRGETILSDGTREIRSRCGNRLSLYPLLPVEENGPTAMELDALTDDRVQPVLDASVHPTFAPLLPGLKAALPASITSSSAALPAVADAREGRTQSGGSTPIIGLPLLVAGRTPDATDDLYSQGAPTPQGLNQQDRENPSEPRAVWTPPSIGDVPPVRIVPGTDTPSFESFNSPPELVPVPEPGTLLLVGGGAMILVFRRFRRGR